ncbi:MAG: lipid A biosynthesis acyltransferase [Planctomycetes bacterium]|nr:lipid A biosynthesis acyltransferase [Planctomycetota bacterium]
MSWVDVEERGSVLGMRFVIGCLKTFGRRFAGVVCEPVFLYFFIVNGRARRASRRYLQRISATPEGRRALGREADLWASWQHFRSFGHGLIDRACAWGGLGHRFAIDFPARPELLRLQAAGRGAILLGAHLGNFDFLRAVVSKKGMPLNVLLFEGNARKINAVLKSVAPGRDVRAIQVEPGSIQSMLDLQACVERGEFVALLGDRAQLANAKHVGRTTFLGAEAPFPLGPLLIAHALQCPVYLLFALKTGRASYEIRFEPFADQIHLGRPQRERDLALWLERYVRRLEELCRAQPLEWFNFYDFWGDEVPRDTVAAGSGAPAEPEQHDAPSAGAETIRA